MGLGRGRIEEGMVGCLCWDIHVWSNCKGRVIYVSLGSTVTSKDLVKNNSLRFRFMLRHSLGGALPRPVSVRGSNFSNSNSKHHH